MRIIFGIFVLLLSCLPYFRIKDEFLLLLVPLLSLVSLKLLGRDFKHSLAVVFLLFLLASSVLHSSLAFASLYITSSQLGILSYILFASLVAVLLAEQAGGKHEPG